MPIVCDVMHLDLGSSEGIVSHVQKHSAHEYLLQCMSFVRLGIKHSAGIHQNRAMNAILGLNLYPNQSDRRFYSHNRIDIGSSI